MSTSDQVIQNIKNGVKTTEFYLATFVTVVGAVVQFLPASKADAAVKIAGAISAVLSVLGYTASRTVVKTTPNV